MPARAPTRVLEYEVDREGALHIWRRRLKGRVQYARHSLVHTHTCKCNQEPPFSSGEYGMWLSDLRVALEIIYPRPPSRPRWR
jgi:hypothetical protein